MPSLQALQSFRTSFDAIGNEEAVLQAQNMPFEDLPLPEIEADLPDEAAEAAAEEAAGVDALAQMGLDPSVAAALGVPAAPEPEPAPPEADTLPDAGLGDLDMSALLGDISDDLPGIPDIPDEFPELPEDDIGLPDGLLDGLAEDIEQAPPDGTGEPEISDPGDLDAENFDLGDTAGLDLGGDIEGLDLGGDAEALDLGGDAGSLDLGGDAESLDLGGDAEGLDLGGDAEALDLDGDAGSLDLGGDAESLDLGGDAESLDLGGDAGSLDLGGDAEGLDLGGDAGSLDLGGDTEGLDLGGDAEALDLGGDTENFDLGDAESLDLGGDAEGLDLGGDAGSIDLGDAGSLDLGGDAESLDLGGDAEGLDLGGDAGSLDLGGDADFSVSDDAVPTEDLDLEGFLESDLVPSGEDADSFDKFNLEGSGAAAVPDEEEGEESPSDMDLGDFTLPGIDDVLGDSALGAGKGRRSIFAGPVEEAEPEEIQLDETDLSQLQRTLAGYPLNLRLAVEECIVEQAVAPDQMATLVRLLVRSAPAKETAALVGKILNRTIVVPKGFQKKTGAALEAEQGCFAYLFVHSFLPIFGMLMFILAVASSAVYLIYRFVYTPAHANSIYQLGYDRIINGEYERANDRFTQAFNLHRQKNWFYRYAEGFRDQRQYLYAEEKYDELLRYYPRDKKGVLDYAALETYYLRNYAKADLLLRRNILEYNPNDADALLAQGDNALAWGEEDPSKYEDARFAYARLLDRYGWTDPVAERMLRYFIRTDNLKEVLPLQSFFMDNPKHKITAETLAELGGYLLDKRTEEVQGVPNAYVEQIEGVRDVLLKAVLQGPNLPEAHYHLSRYYRNLGNTREEQQTLEVALHAFDNARQESVRRLIYHIRALKRDAEILTGRREFFAVE
jgi:tetratricopeptide (TPR) repeat protein